MSKNQYDISEQPDYLNRQMFLNGPVTVQRFEELAYPELQKYEELARSYYWIPEEINLMKDKLDFTHKDTSEADKHVFTTNIHRQTVLDSGQGRGPIQVFAPVISVPELEALVTTWSFFETSIHSKSYSHIIRSIYNMPKEEFNRIHHNPEIVQMMATIGMDYQALHILNCRREIWENTGEGRNPSDEEMIDAIWMALHTSYALEAIRFAGSFTTSLAQVENEKFIGTGNIITLIMQDELNVHKKFVSYIIRQVVKDDPRFAAAAIRNKDKVRALYENAIKEELSFANYLFFKGPITGMNTKIMRDTVEFISHDALGEIGIDRPTEVKYNPVPWMGKHTDTKKMQKALQETQSTAYVLGLVKGELNLDTLPNL